MRGLSQLCQSFPPACELSEFIIQTSLITFYPDSIHPSLRLPPSTQLHYLRIEESTFHDISIQDPQETRWQIPIFQNHILLLTAN